MQPQWYIVSGASGFLGKHVIRSILASGSHVLGLNFKQHIGFQHPRFRIITGPLNKSLNECEKFIKNIPPETQIIVHLAGLADASLCFSQPDYAHQSNVDLTARMLDFAKKNQISKFIFPSTYYVYGAYGNLDENVRPAPVGPYANSKYAAESLVKEYGKGGVIVRLSNVYGPDSNPETIIGKLLCQYRSGMPLHVRNETPVRDFIYVKDVAEGIMRLSSIPFENPVVVNLGSGKGVSIAKIVRLFVEYTACHYNKPQEQDRGAKSNVMILCLEKLLRLTHWQPTISLKEGLRMCINQPEGIYEQS